MRGCRKRSWSPSSSCTNGQQRSGVPLRKSGRPDGKKIVGWEQVRPETVEVDLDAAITRLHDAAQMIEGGFGGWIDAYHDYLQDMWREYESNLQYGY